MELNLKLFLFLVAVGIAIYLAVEFIKEHVEQKRLLENVPKRCKGFTPDASPEKN